MRRLALFTVVIGAVLALYAAVSLWPYQWQVRGCVVNAAEPLPDGGVRFRKPGIAIAKGRPVWVATAMRYQRLKIFLTVRSLAPKQFGPARILTFSLNPYERNLMVGQEGADLIFRLRTAWTDENGTIDERPVARVPGVFVTDDWVDLWILVEPGSLRIVVGGQLLEEEPLPLRPFETWDASYRLALGNELTTGARPWLGEIRRAMMRAGDSSKDYAEASQLEFPPRFLNSWESPKLIPLRELNYKDAVNNVFLYIPLGVLLGLLLGKSRRERHWRVTCGVLIFIAVMSASMEVLQVFLPRRSPSIDDVIFNTFGGGLGLLLGNWARQWLGAAIRL